MRHNIREYSRSYYIAHFGRVFVVFFLYLQAICDLYWNEKVSKFAMQQITNGNLLEIIDLANSLRQEHLFIANEQNAFNNLNDALKRNSANVAQVSHFLFFLHIILWRWQMNEIEIASMIFFSFVCLLGTSA